MTTPAKNGNGWAKTALMIVAAGLWTLLAGAYLALNSKVSETRDTAVQALRATVRIEARLKTMDDAATAAATAQREASAARISELEGIQRTRDRAPQ